MRTAVAVATVEPQVAPAPRTPPTRRSGPSARKTPAITINYAYLRRDIRAVAVLAPSMIILVIVAYLVLH